MERWVLRRRYPVRVVRGLWIGHVADWPVIGPPHEDGALLNFPWRHYHVDGRFVPAALWRKAAAYSKGRWGSFGSISDAWRTTLVAPVQLEFPWSSRIFTVRGKPAPDPEDLGIHELRMVRHCPDTLWRYFQRAHEIDQTNTDNSHVFAPHKKPIRTALEDAFEESVLGDDLICPHRGANLRGMPVDADGCVTCPLHGLRWDLETRRIRRYARPEPIGGKA